MRHKLSIVLLMLVFNTQSAFAEVIINMDAIKQIESSGNPGAFNKQSKCRGWYQVSEVCLKDFNQVHGTNYNYKRADLYDPQINSRIAHWMMDERIPQLLRHFKLKDTLEHRLLCYNAGIKAVKDGRMPSESKQYIIKYKNLVKAY